jgi:non-specific protein-tyrosine kinase
MTMNNVLTPKDKKFTKMMQMKTPDTGGPAKHSGPTASKPSQGPERPGPRQQVSRVSRSTESKTVRPEPPPKKGPVRKDTSGWLSPKYSSSQEVRLDPLILEQNRIVCMFPEKPEVEPYRLLRTQILHKMRDRNWNTLMITSPRSGDGKTATAINLSLTFAREYNHTALLVDCDLKKQSIHKALGYECKAGLVDYLLFDAPMKDLIVWPGIEKLTIISGGRIIQDSTELLGSKRMKELVHEMKNRYDDRFVFFDLPPLLETADAMAFAPIVDGIILVVREGVTATDEVRRSLEMIPREKFLGFVMNARRDLDAVVGNYGYYYR